MIPFFPQIFGRCLFGFLQLLCVLLPALPVLVWIAACSFLDSEILVHDYEIRWRVLNHYRKVWEDFELLPALVWIAARRLVRQIAEKLSPTTLRKISRKLLP
jgi:hypothetical protein